MARRGKSAKAQCASGAAYATKGQYDRAIMDFDEAIRLNPRDADTFYARGEAYRNKGDYNCAIADYSDAIRLNSKDAFIFYRRGFAWRHKGQHDWAIADFDEAIRLNPNEALAFNERGNAYRAKGQLDRAIADYDEATRLDPDFTEAINSRAKIIAKKNELATTPQTSVAKLITPEDQESYGTELIDLAKRAAKEAMAPELNALTQKLKSQLAAMGNTNARGAPSPHPPAKLITPEDEQAFGTELIDLVRRAAQEALAPEVDALTRELQSQLAAMQKMNTGTMSGALAAWILPGQAHPNDRDGHRSCGGWRARRRAGADEQDCGDDQGETGGLI
jgi:Tfp pilus assembly protein PilF